MKLDERIIDRKYIFDCFNPNMASMHIGKKCYMTNNFDMYSDLESTILDTLYKIDDNGYFHRDNGQWFTFCIPAEFVKPEDSKYKPFDPVIFEQHYGVGSVIKYRRKDEKYLTYKAIVTSTTSDDISNEFYVIMRGYAYTLNDLFKEYEICENGEWKPFGIEE